MAEKAIPPERTQSMLHPVGPAAETIAELWWFMLIVLGIAFVIVMAMVWIGVQKKEDPHRQPFGNKFVIWGGVVLPSIVLFVLLIYSLNTSIALRSPEARLDLEVTGHQWWWEVRYPQHGIVTANEIHIPVGEPVRVTLRSADVIHSFWAPNLGGKMDMLPDHETTLTIESRRTGVFRGQCAEYCGLQHARMSFRVVVQERDEFEQWVARARAPAPEPATAEQARGQEAYFGAGCNNCHAIRGTESVATIGPDLTHIASRLTLGAGTIPNNHGNMAGWVANPQAIKPGNLMPPSYVAPEDFHALLEYLASLE